MGLMQELVELSVSLSKSEAKGKYRNEDHRCPG
jgi:hypothetical protein